MLCWRALSTLEKAEGKKKVPKKEKGGKESKKGVRYRAERFLGEEGRATVHWRLAWLHSIGKVCVLESLKKDNTM